jgi:CRP/FNR family transcriptional regulator, anaerobic regulatory protein
MSPKLISSYLEPFYNISEEALQYLATQFEEVKYPPKHIYLNEGEPCTKGGIIHKGLVRNFFTRNGRECTSWFDAEGSFAVSSHSFFTQSTFSESIEFLEESIVFEITYEKIEKAKMLFTDIDMLLEKILLYGFYTVEERTRNLIAYNAVERYELFFKTYPSLINRIPVKYLASFLSVTPETLSRIRARSYK